MTWPPSSASTLPSEVRIGQWIMKEQDEGERRGREGSEASYAPSVYSGDAGSIFD